jgi:hypothetical protein
VDEKTKDLPSIEVDKIKEKTKGMGLEEVTEKYDSILKAVRESTSEEKTIENNTNDIESLEEAIDKILEQDKKCDDFSDKDTGCQESYSTDESNDGLVSISES